MSDLYMDISRINKAVNLYKKAVFFTVSMVVLYIISAILDSDFLSGFTSVISPFLLIIGLARIMGSMSGNNYVLLSTLPIKMKNIPNIIFKVFELTCFISYGCCCITALISGGIDTFIFQIITMLITMIFGYLFISGSASPESSINLAQGTNLKGFALGMLFYFSFSALNAVVASVFREFDTSLLFYLTNTIIILALIAVCIFIRGIMFDRTYKKIRGIKNNNC